MIQTYLGDQLPLGIGQGLFVLLAGEACKNGGQLQVRQERRDPLVNGWAE